MPNPTFYGGGEGGTGDTNKPTYVYEKFCCSVPLSVHEILYHCSSRHSLYANSERRREVVCLIKTRTVGRAVNSL